MSFFFVRFLGAICICCICTGIVFRAQAAEKTQSPPDSPCPPCVVLSGNTQLGEQLAIHPLLDGITWKALPGCPAVWVDAGTRGRAIVIGISDHEGRRTNRTASNLDSAAALIDSWVRGDTVIADVTSENMKDTSLSMEASNSANINVTSDHTSAQPASMKPTLLPTATDTVPPTRNIDSPSAASMDVTAGAGFEYTIGSDASSWFGGIAYWCTAFGPICLGMVLRGGADPGVSGKYRQLNSERSGMDAMLLATIPLAVKRVRISPGIAFGAGWSQTSRREVIENEPVFYEKSFGGMRVAFSCTTSIALYRGLQLDGGVTFAGSFIVEEETIFIDGVEVAGELRNFFRFSLGLSWRWL